MSEWYRGVMHTLGNGDMCIPPEENGKNEIKVGEPRSDGYVLYKNKLVFNEKKDNSHHPIEW